MLDGEQEPGRGVAIPGQPALTGLRSGIGSMSAMAMLRQLTGLLLRS
jgi:hypothetical protein